MGEGKAELFDSVNDALNRMKRAHDRGTGCHLTAEMIADLATTFLAETWSEDDPRLAKARSQSPASLKGPTT